MFRPVSFPCWGSLTAALPFDKGQRASTAHAYIRANPGRANLTIADRALAQGLIHEGNRIGGVTYRRGGELISARARREPRIVRAKRFGTFSRQSSTVMRAMNSPGVSV